MTESYELYADGMQAEMSAFMTNAALSTGLETFGNAAALTARKLTIVGASGALALGVATAEASTAPPLHTYGWLKQHCVPTQLTIDPIVKDKHLAGKRATIDFKVKYRVVNSFASGKFSWKEKPGQAYCGIARRTTEDGLKHTMRPSVLRPDHLTATTGDWTDYAAVPKNPGAPGNELIYGAPTEDFILFTRKK